MLHLVAVVLCSALAVPKGAGDLADLFPPGRLGTLVVPSGQALFDCAPVQRALQRLREAGALTELEAGRGALHLAVGTDPAEWLAFLLGGELQLGAYEGPPRPDGEGAGRRQLLGAARTPDSEGCQRILDALLAVIESDEGNDVRRRRHRDVSCASVNRNLHVAHHESILLLSSEHDLLTAALDRLLDGARAAAPAPAADGLLAFELDPELLRPRDVQPAAGAARRALGRRLTNPLGNLLFAGLLLEEGRVSGSLHAAPDALELRVALPPAPGDAPAAFFPPGAEAFEVPVDDETLAVLALRRDLGDWWRQRESLMSGDSQAQIAKADETLSLLFMGSSPAEDVFSALGTELALVLDRQTFDGMPEPDVKLPGACLVARLREPAAFGPAVQVAFQTLVGFLNTERAQQREAPFLLDSVEHEGVTLRAARLLPGEDEAPGTDANASPAVAVVDDWLFVGTSLEQVLRLVSALRAGALRPVAAGALSLHVDVVRALQLARDNRDVLVANSILEDGLSALDASKQVDEILSLLGELRSLDLSVLRAADRLDVRLRLALVAAP